MDDDESHGTRDRMKQGIFVAIALLSLLQAEISGDITLVPTAVPTAPTTSTAPPAAPPAAPPTPSFPEEAVLFIIMSVLAMLLLMWWFDRETGDE